jgi:hypothetical protein
MKTLVVVLAAVAAALAVAGDVLAAEIVRSDAEGRPIRLDVRAGGVDADWYAGLLRRAAHADEISTVTIRIVDRDDLREMCGRRAGGCYRGRRGGGVVIVPAGRTSAVAHTLLHEYAHHIDRSEGHDAAREPNGTRNWWRTRQMGRLVSQGSVFRSYRGGGWSRSIAEIFAEDYAHTQIDSRYAIPWLSPPGQAVKQAILADLGRARPPTTTQPPALRPVVIERQGTLAPGDRVTIPFGLLGPGRRVTFTATVTGASARLELTCGRRVGAKSVAPGQGRVSLDVHDLGPAGCRATLVGTSSGALGFRATLRLAIEGG